MDTQTHRSTETVCDYAYGQEFFVGVTGNIIPCCNDLEEELLIGSVKTMKPAEAIDALYEFYKQVPKYRLCQKCIGGK